MPGTVTGKIARINQVTRGWINYYALDSMRTAMTEIDAHRAQLAQDKEALKTVPKENKTVHRTVAKTKNKGLEV